MLILLDSLMVGIMKIMYGMVLFILIIILDLETMFLDEWLFWNSGYTQYLVHMNGFCRLGANPSGIRILTSTGGNLMIVVNLR